MNTQNKLSFESSLKSTDTEEFIDIHFYRPIGYQWAMFFHKRGISPNQITFAAIIIGMAAGVCFYFTNIWITVLGIFLLIWANSYDSADGQLARMTNQKSDLGRILDGACGDFWFGTIYIAIIIRLWNEWDFWILVIALISGYFHSKQAAMADYYRNVHLLFLRGKKGSELDNTKNLANKLALNSLNQKPLVAFFEGMYFLYTQGQELWSPNLQKLLFLVDTRYKDEAVPESFKEKFREKSFPLMKYTNWLSFNLRSIVLFISLLIGYPWVYFCFEITVMNIMLFYMVRRHEQMCKQLIRFFYPLSGDESKYIKQEISAGNRPALSINSRFKRWTTNLLCSIANKPKPFNLEKVKGIIFDYGATIDTNGKHWAETLWDAYQDANVPVTKDAFRDAYVYVERFFATHSIIKPRDNFKAVLTAKTKFQIKWLIDNGFLNDDNNSSQYSVSISNKCYNFVCSVLTDAKPVLEKLKLKYPLVLVSNFYGNMEAVLNDFGLDNYFEEIIESAKVNIRKPNPAIFELGVKALGLDSRNVVVIGDSWTKDIAPAQKTGCQTIWLKGLTWETCKEGQRANLVIDDFKKLEEVFNV